MLSTTVWYSGLNNFKKNTFKENNKFQQHIFNLELLDQDIPNNRTLDEIFLDHVSNRQTKFIEVLYSGGLDSELVLNSCLNNKLPVRAVTMRLIAKGFPINTHDLYYSEKFCRERNVPQLFVDLDLDKFFETGLFYELLEPYKINMVHVATHFWLFKQCTGFPILGGDYSWPQIDAGKNIISPHRHAFALYDKFLSDNNITGIGNMLSYSAESNLYFLKNHIELFKNDIDNLYGGDDYKITFFKKDLCKKAGHTQVEHRMKSYGWDLVYQGVLNYGLYTRQLEKHFGTTKSSVTWNQQIASVLNGVPGTNDNYGTKKIVKVFN